MFTVRAFFVVSIFLLAATSTVGYSNPEPATEAGPSDEPSFRPAEASPTDRGRPPSRLPYGIPRVAGLSVTIDNVTASGPGMGVDFSVQMTTVREVPLSVSGETGTTNVAVLQFFGPHATVGSHTLTQEVYNFAGGSPQHLGLLKEGITQHLRETLVRDGTWLYANPYPPTNIPFTGYDFSGRSTDVEYTRIDQTMPATLPGIEFGDGATQWTTSIPLLATVSTTPKAPGSSVGLRTRIFRRGGLSYTYDDRSPKQIRVRSGCCSAANFPFDSSGSRTAIASLDRGGTFGHSISSTGYQTPVAGTFRATGGEVTYMSRTSTAPSGTSISTSTNFTNQSSFQRSYYVDQVSATADVDFLAIQPIPSLGYWGLSALSFALVGLSLVILRKP